MPVEKRFHSIHTKEDLKRISAQKDPPIQYLIVRKSLNMNPGKVAAQCNHAGKYIMQWYYESSSLREKDDVVRLGHDINYWMRSGGRVAILQANDKQWEKIKEELRCIVVKDAGVNTDNTENEETVLAIFPMIKSQAPKIIKRLQLYK